VIKAEAREAIPERFCVQLQHHSKKFYQCSNKADILTEDDDVSIEFDELSPALEFSLTEFDDIPGLFKAH